MDNKRLNRIHHKNRIKKKINKRFQNWFDDDDFTKEEFYLWRRRFFRNENKGFSHKCDCSWCTLGREAKDRRQYQRISYDYEYFFIREEDISNGI